MKHWLITDDPEKFKRSDALLVLLMRKEQVLKARGAGADVSVLNAAQAGVELKAAEHLLRWMDTFLRELRMPKEFIPPVLAKQPATYTAKALLHYALKETFLDAFILREQLQVFRKILSLPSLTAELSMGERFHFFPAGFYDPHCRLSPGLKSTRAKKSPLKKNIVRLAGKALHPAVPAVQKGKRRILFLTQSPVFNNRLFRRFYEIASSDKETELVVLHYASLIGSPAKKEIALFRKHGIRFYEYSDFKTHNPLSTEFFRKELSRQIPLPLPEAMDSFLEATLLNYHWMPVVLDTIRPDLVLTYTLGEPGRWLADTARFRGIPAAYVEYSLFTDDAFWMEPGIAFSKRFCIGPESVQLWKRRKDPTPEHVPLGFTGFDTADPPVKNKEKKRQLLFASTWSGTHAGYQDQKKLLIRELADCCQKEGFQLVIKKHPSETDTIAEDTIRSGGYKNTIIVGKESQDRLLQLISDSDLVCCQNSSIGLEALYMQKPFCYLNPFEDRISQYSLLHRAGYSRTFRNPAEMFEAWKKGSFPSREEIALLRPGILNISDQPAGVELFRELKKMMR
ncbi:MAG: hypothetical protein IT233_05685 [Bacteroidia bacterium]|nr:hypothetical protein [Bacteroidia bacterium]